MSKQSKQPNAKDPTQRATPRRDDLSSLDKPALPADQSAAEAQQGVPKDAKTAGAGPNRKRPNPEAKRPGPTPGGALDSGR